MLRSRLERRETRVGTLDEEMRLLRHYLQIEQARLGDRLSVGWDIEPGLDDALVPPLLLQPLVENAIRHAIAAKIAAGRLEVRAWRDGGRLCLAIRDDGGVLPAPIRNGVGLSNIRARLQLLYGEDHAIELERREDGGTEARVAIPLSRGARMMAAA